MVAPVTSNKKRPAQEACVNPWIEKTRGDVQQAANLIFAHYEKNQWIIAPRILQEEILPQVLNLIQEGKENPATFESVNRVAVDILKKTIYYSLNLQTAAFVYNNFWRTNNPLFSEVKEITVIKFLNYVEPNPTSFAHMYHLETQVFCVSNIPFENGDIFSLVLSWLQSKHGYLYNSLLASNPSSALAHRLKSIHHREEREYQQALEELDLYLHIYPDDQDCLRMKGKLLLRLNNPGTKLFAEEFATRFPNPKNQLFLANIYWRLGALPQALNYFEQYNRYTNDIDGYLAAACIRFQEKNWIECRKICDRIQLLKKETSHLPSLCLRARVHINTNRSSNLLDVIAKIQASPSNIDHSLLYSGYYHLLRQEYDKAMIFFDLGIKKRTGPLYYIGFARVNLAMEDYSEAANNLERAMHAAENYAISIVNTDNFTQANFSWWERLCVHQEVEQLKKEMNAKIASAYLNRIGTDPELSNLQNEVLELITAESPIGAQTLTTQVK